MARSTAKQNMSSFLVHPLRLPVNLGDQGAGLIDISEAALLRRPRNRFGNAVCRKNHRPIVRHLIELVDEHSAKAAQAIDDEAIVDDLMPHIDGRSEALECKLDDLDGPIDSGAKTARGRDEDSKGR